MYDESQLNFSDSGKVCDACLVDQEVDEMLERGSLGGAWVQLGLGVMAASGIISMSSRSVNTSSTTVGGMTTTTVTYDLDALAASIAVFAGVMLLLAFLGAIRGKGTQRILVLLGVVVTTPLAGFRVYQAMPKSEITQTGPAILCAEGDLNACNSAGVAADNAGDLEVAAGFFDQACAGGLALGCRNLGYVRSRMESPDWALTLAAHQRGCELDDLRACNGAAAAAAKLGDTAAQMSFYQRACELGSGMGCSNHGVVLSQQTNLDWEPVYQAYKKACGLDYGNGCLMVHAAWSELGQRDERVAEVRALVSAGCDKGLPPACTAWGVMLDNAQGGALDKAAGLVAFKQACAAEEPHALGCLNAAFVTADPEEKQTFFKKACELGESRGCGRENP